MPFTEGGWNRAKGGLTRRVRLAMGQGGPTTVLRQGRTDEMGREWGDASHRDPPTGRATMDRWNLGPGTGDGCVMLRQPARDTAGTRWSASRDSSYEPRAPLSPQTLVLRMRRERRARRRWWTSTCAPM